ncbi:ROK family protein [Spiroplasma tabanidicola]|uniref:ROK family protein n=1 Tax=Spiroplasma tabanidicola TaxID=324079 RepID=A0A6I6C9L2_9MOLU|nr:ROK family protein [Spiroplasma tabanidicola]QGS52276.1 ROK family protein [Spiroplasma tabanidicola]
MLRNLCFDVGGMSTKVALFENCEIIKRDKIEYGKLINSMELLEKIIFYIENFIDLKSLNNISIASPGVVDVNSGWITGLSAIADNDKINMKKELQKKFNKKVFIENDAKCAALAEINVGNGKKYQNLFLFVIGTGIGGAVIINKKIYKGSKLAAGEFGCVLEKLDKNEFHNGSHYGGMYNLEYKYKNISGKAKSGKEIYNLYAKDELCKNLINEQIFQIAKLIINTNFVLDADAVLVGGAISANDLFIDLLNKKLTELYFLSGMQKNIVLDRCKFTNDANIIGANQLEVAIDKVS